MTLAGSVITVLGSTVVFVPQDITYLGFTRAQLNALNPHLVPLIAHDRAGFGGGLACCGLTVLLIVWKGAAGTRAVAGAAGGRGDGLWVRDRDPLPDGLSERVAPGAGVAGGRGCMWWGSYCCGRGSRLLASGHECPGMNREVSCGGLGEAQKGLNLLGFARLGCVPDSGCEGPPLAPRCSLRAVRRSSSGAT